MDINEFLLRFSLIRGQKITKLKKISSLPSSFNLTQLRTYFSLLTLTPEQQHEFLHTEKTSLQSTLTWLENPSHTLIHYLHPDYPPLLKAINGAPLLLFVQGNSHLLATPQIAMVGSRRCTSYGQSMAHLFASQLATRITITSGLALGIDRACHCASLLSDGLTIAILGSGHLHLTPKQHYALAQHILEKRGAIVSEFMPCVSAKPSYFPRRNRIISGLSLATLIIEATLKSGSLITAHYALEQGREVFVLPGKENCPAHEGNLQLIEDGATVVTDPEHLLHLTKKSTLLSFTSHFLK